MIPILGGIIGEKAAKLVAPFMPYIIGAALIALAFTLGRCDGVSDERARNEAAVARANAAALRIVNAANEIAAANRILAERKITAQSKDRTDAIEAAPPSRTGAATRALGCVRLRQAGYHREADAAGCGR